MTTKFDMTMPIASVSVADRRHAVLQGQRQIPSILDDAELDAALARVKTMKATWHKDRSSMTISEVRQFYRDIHDAKHTMMAGPKMFTLKDVKRLWKPEFSLDKFIFPDLHKRAA